MRGLIPARAFCPHCCLVVCVPLFLQAPLPGARKHVGCKRGPRITKKRVITDCRGLQRRGKGFSGCLSSCRAFPSHVRQRARALSFLDEGIGPKEAGAGSLCSSHSCLLKGFRHTPGTAGQGQEEFQKSFPRRDLNSARSSVNHSFG